MLLWHNTKLIYRGGTYSVHTYTVCAPKVYLLLQHKLNFTGREEHTATKVYWCNTSLIYRERRTQRRHSPDLQMCISFGRGTRSWRTRGSPWGARSSPWSCPRRGGYCTGYAMSRWPCCVRTPLLRPWHSFATGSNKGHQSQATNNSL